MPTEISGSTGVNKIQDGTIVNADISSSAAIANSKLVGAGGVNNADHWYFVTPSTDQNSAAVVNFNTQISKGSNITASGGRMTVATAGMYAIDFHFSNQSAFSDNMSVHLRKNGTRVNGTIYWEGNTEINYMGMHAHVLIQASANDIFDIYGSGYWDGDTNNNAVTWFCGIRLGA